MMADRFPYRDGVGAQRCHGCLRLWRDCACERFTMRFFEVDNVGCYLDAIGHRVERTDDGDEIKMIDLTLRVQPFTVDLAAACDPDVRALLFTLGDAHPKKKLREAKFTLPCPPQILTVQLAPGEAFGALVLHDVEITGPRANARGRGDRPAP